MLKYLLVTSLLAGALATASSLYAADSTAKTSSKATTEAKPKKDSYPFYGYVASVDKQANTISLKKKEGQRVLKLDSQSTLEMNGQSAVIGSVIVGYYAHGTLHKDSAGKEVIKNAKFDKEKPAKAKEPAPKATTKTTTTK